MPRHLSAAIRWSTDARRDAAAIARYISTDNPVAARNVLRKIQGHISGLYQYPLKGRVGRKAGTRELVVIGAPYIVIYSFIDTAILIEHVLHTAQQWPPEDE